MPSLRRLRLTNGTPFELTGSVWSSDRNRAWVLAEQIDAGVTFVNQHGIGREMGSEGLLELTWSQQVSDRHVV